MKEKTSRSSSVDKALMLLNCFSEQEYMLGLDDIAKKTAIPKSTVFRMITSLESFGYVKSTKIANKTWYSLGYTFIEKGFMAHRNLDIRELSREHMLGLRNQLNLNVQLAIQDGLDALYVEQIQSWRPIRLYPAIGRRAPLYAAACPRVLLAYLDEQEQEVILQKASFKMFTENTPTEIEVVQKEINQVKKDGYSLSEGELFEGTLAIAVPVFHPASKQVIAALSVVGMEGNFEEPLSYYINILKKVSQIISKNVSES